jgi:hypothetical protein
MVETTLTQSLYYAIGDVFSYIPEVVAVIIFALVGWIIGRSLGKIGAKLLERTKVDNTIDNTFIGKVLKRAEITTKDFFGSAVKWFVYIVFAAIIIDYLQIRVVADFITLLLTYIPLVIAAAIILVIGIVIVDFVSRTTATVLSTTGMDEKIESGPLGKSTKTANMKPSMIVAGIIKLFGYLFFIAAAANILQLELITDFLIMVTTYIPRLLLGVIILTIGLLSVDFLMDYIRSMIAEMNMEGTDIFVPLLRGFLFLVVVLIALDTMLVNTGILYTFLRPLAWGIAVVVAFRWGIKDALVEYGKQKK